MTRPCARSERNKSAPSELEQQTRLDALVSEEKTIRLSKITRHLEPSSRDAIRRPVSGRRVLEGPRSRALRRRHPEVQGRKRDGARRERKIGGADRDRTDDLRLAKPALSQLSYSPALLGIHLRLLVVVDWKLANGGPGKI